MTTEVKVCESQQEREKLEDVVLPALREHERDDKPRNVDDF